MASVEIKPDVMPFLCQKAEEEGKSVTDVIDELLRLVMDNGGNGKTVILQCHNCRNEIDYEVSDNKGYCDYCESLVFIDKTYNI